MSNSKAFTAKTSCVRRRYSEFVWLKKKLQKNSGLVPVPELPPKTPFFSVNNDDFIEKRREGLQQFLEKVVNRTVFLSDSQLHLFLQTQLSPAQIEACVQGHAPCSVTTAILRYASSNQGCAQEEGGWAMQEDHERILPLFYESPDSPAPHLQPSECESSSEISLVESDAHA
ncbi:Sorting nexin-11 [Acipenser ruthenus]|uniref:Sorting nexin-11 n=1 Tax=Acipenser ruthenus TaxID=7906 RepID=A0A444UP52_ACIRT|nr:Sorting nexin-11 [Acipenser ruthenus]